MQPSKMKKQDTEESASQDSDNATCSRTKMESSTAGKDSSDKSPEASESQLPQTDAQSQTDEAVSEGKDLNVYRTNSGGFLCVKTCSTLACKLKLSVMVHM